MINRRAGKGVDTERRQQRPAEPAQPTFCAWTQANQSEDQQPLDECDAGFEDDQLPESAVSQ
jgi:hypothetical protein